MEIDSVLACRKGVTWGGGFVGVVPRWQHNRWVWFPR